MPNASAYLPLTAENLKGVKRALGACFQEEKSSHLTEALAAALGQRTHAALLALVRVSDPANPEFVRLDEAAFAARLEALTGQPNPPQEFVGLFDDLTYPSGTEVIRTWSLKFDQVQYDSDRRKAWRNMMVAAINAGLAQRLFTVRAGDNRWPGAEEARHRYRPALYRFEVEGIPALASVDDAGFDELRLHVAFWPTKDSERWVGAEGHGFRAGDAWTYGWLERRKGAYLMTPAPDGFQFNCRKRCLNAVAALDVQPRCYADRGSFH